MSAAWATNAAAGGGAGKAQGAATTTAPTGNNKITIGEALEAAGMTAGDKPVEQSDAAVIQAAEVRATGINNILPGGLAAASQSAADANVRATTKTTLGDILADAAERLPSDKTVTRGDAEGVMAAELRNSPNIQAAPGGVAASMAAAARFNQKKQL